MKRIPRLLSAAECRVLGSLLEKEQATPEYYPMTVPAVVAAANQQSNREPVMQLTTAEVEAALRALFQDVLVWRSAGPRATKWSQSVDRRWSLAPATKAVMTLLLVRGPQTTGELRGRSERLHSFASIADIETTLAALAEGDEPLVRELARAPGEKQTRWVHLVGEDAPSVAAAPRPERPSLEAARSRRESVAAPARDELADRLTGLETQVADLARAVAELARRLDPDARDSATRDSATRDSATRDRDGD